jgi:hypothetical protein
MEPYVLLIITAAVFVIIGGVVVIGHFVRLGKKRSKSPYVKRPEFLSSEELKLFNTLAEVCGEQYLVLPQVHLGSILEVKPGVDWKEVSNQRSKIDRKPADFVICSKAGAVLAVVDTGRDNDNFPDKKSRDGFLEDLAQIEGLPLVRLRPGMSADAVRAELKKVLPNL